jgi:hypothetical protein
MDQSSYGAQPARQDYQDWQTSTYSFFEISSLILNRADYAQVITDYYNSSGVQLCLTRCLHIISSGNAANLFCIVACDNDRDPISPFFLIALLAVPRKANMRIVTRQIFQRMHKAVG